MNLQKKIRKTNVSLKQTMKLPGVAAKKLRVKDPANPQSTKIWRCLEIFAL